MAKIIVGIDFGTSTTAVRWRKENSDEVHVIKDADGVSSVIDSVIFIPENGGDWTYGKLALVQAGNSSKGSLVRNFKMDLVSSESRERTVMYIRKFMEYIYSLFIKQTGGVSYDFREVYVSYPVKWSLENKTLMKKIVADSGFSQGGVVVGKTEPMAAAVELVRTNLHHFTKSGMLKAQKPMNIMMLDMGAGTSDLFLFQLSMTSKGEIIVPEDKIRQYPVAMSPYNCGGREIDDALSKEVLDYLLKGSGGSAKEQWFDAKKAKDWKDQVLSSSLQERGNATRIVGLPSNVSTLVDMLEERGVWDKTIGDYKMSPSKFEAKTEAHWDDLYKLIEEGVAKFKHECNVGAEDIDFIFLTGGHSQWYCVPYLFNGVGINGTVAVDEQLRFTKIAADPWRIFQGVNPQETVANGLCWPDAIKIPAIAERDVSVRLGVKGCFSPYKEIVKKGELLPCHVCINDEDSEYNTVTITDNLVFSDNRIPLEFTVLERDTNVINCTLSTFKAVYDDKYSFLSRCWVTLCTAAIACVLSYDFKFKYTVDIEVREDGTLGLSGSLYCNGEKVTDFSDKDFIVVSSREVWRRLMLRFAKGFLLPSVRNIKNV